MHFGEVLFLLGCVAMAGGIAWVLMKLKKMDEEDRHDEAR